MLRKNLFVWLILVSSTVLGLVAAGCGAAPTPQIVEKEVVVEKKVVETVIVEKEVPVEKEVVREVVKEVMVTPVPAPTEDRYGGTFYHAAPSKPQRFFPPETTASSQRMRATQIFASLVAWKVGTPGDVEPDLAESWDVSDDGLVYTFHLRKGAVFHNGREITADDVIFSLEQFATEGRPHSAKLQIIDSMKALDDHTVEITLKNPTPYFLQAIAGVYASAIMPRDVVEELGDDFGTSPETTVGSGPFTLARWTDTEIVFDAFDDYFFGRPYLDHWVERNIPEADTRVLELRAGNVDMLYLDNPYKLEFMEDPEWKDRLHVGTHLNTWYYLFDPDISPYDDIRVRQAINWAVDMDKLLAISRGGVATTANQIIQPGLGGHDDSLQYYRPRDLDKARALLAEAGYPTGIDGQMYVWNRREAVQDAEVLVAQVKEAGINIELVPVEFSTYISEWSKGIYGFYAWGETANPDMATFLHTHWYTGGPRNYIGYSNPDVDDLLDKAVLEMDLDKRAELLVKVEQILLEEAMYVPYMYDRRAIAFQPWVHGFEDVNVNTGQGHWVLRFDKVWLDADHRGQR